MVEAAIEDISDEGLAQRFNAGDKQAFGALAMRHRRPLYNFILRHVGNPAVAEELLQETFLKVARGLASFRKEAKFTTWLYKIARNVCIDALRKGETARNVSLDQPAADCGEEGPTAQDRTASMDRGPEQLASDSGLQEILKIAIRQLPEEQREVFILREYAGLRFEEVARVTEAPLNTVKSRMRYALLSLRKLLEDKGVTP